MLQFQVQALVEVQVQVPVPVRVRVQVRARVTGSLTWRRISSAIEKASCSGTPSGTW